MPLRWKQTEQPPSRTMSLSEQLCFWEARAHELEKTTQELHARIRHLETENEALRRVPQSPPHSPAPRQGEVTFVFEAPQSQPRSQPTFKVDSLLAVAPKTGDDWLKTRERLSLSDERSVIQTFFQLLGGTKFPTTSLAPAADESSSIKDLLRQYQRFTEGLRQETDRMRQITNFSCVLHVSLCRIASISKKVSAETVDECMNNFLPPAKRARGSSVLKKLRTSVVWPVARAQALRPWLGNRADEFFLLYGPSIETYRAIYQETDAPEFVDKLKKRYQLDDNAKDCIISFSMPFMVWVIARQQFSLDEMNQALQTEISLEEFDAWISGVWSTAQRVLGIRCLSAKIQDAPSGQGDEEATDPVSCEQRTQSLAGAAANIPSPLHSLIQVLHSEIQGHDLSASAGLEESGPSQIQCINTGTTKRPHLLLLLADAAAWTHAEPRSAGTVPTLGPTEPISGSLGSPHGFSPSPSQRDLSVGPGAESMEQPSASSYSNASGLVTLSDGSCLPRGYLEGPAPMKNSEHASGTEGKGIDTDGLVGPDGTNLGTPQGHDGPMISDRPAKRQRANREVDELCHGNSGRISAAEHAARQDEGQDESALDLFFEQMVEFPAE